MARHFLIRTFAFTLPQLCRVRLNALRSYIYFPFSMLDSGKVDQSFARAVYCLDASAPPLRNSLDHLVPVRGCSCSPVSAGAPFPALSSSVRACPGASALRPCNIHCRSVPVPGYSLFMLSSVSRCSFPSSCFVPSRACRSVHAALLYCLSTRSCHPIRSDSVILSSTQIMLCLQRPIPSN